MSLRTLTNQVEDILIGIEVQEAVDIVVAYIRHTQKFKEGPEPAYSWWAKLSDSERVDVLADALRWHKR